MQQVDQTISGQEYQQLLDKLQQELKSKQIQTLIISNKILQNDIYIWESLDSVYECMICIDLVQDPVECDQCHKIMCFSCIKPGTSCPNCRKQPHPKQQLHPKMLKQLNQIQENLLGKHLACGQTIKYLEKYLHECRCKSSSVQCPFCDHSVQASNMQSHLIKCPMYSRKCNDCLEKFESLVELIAHEIINQQKKCNDQNYNEVQLIKKDLEEYYVKKGTQIKHGQYKKWHQNGHIYQQCTYVKNKIEGKEKWWHNNGKLKWQCTYAEGQKHGEYKEWYYYGELWHQRTYVNGKKHGEYKSWYSNGQFQEQCTYVDGKLQGEWKFWHENGQLNRQCTYVNGEMQQEYNWWYDNGQLYHQCTYVDGKKHGEYTKWYENGQIMHKKTYVDGKKQGEYKSWYDNGQLLKQCSFVEGKLQGEFKRWHENGQFQEQCTYLDGKLNGEYKSWHENCQLYLQCTYVDGEEIILI